MNLETLLAKGTVKSADLVKKPMVWEHLDPESGETIKEEFDVFVVANITFASQDRILLGGQQKGDSSQMARVISERIRLGDKAEEQMTFEQAANLDPDLGWLLIGAIREVAAEKEAAKKVSQTNSGTNLSSPESAAEPSQKPAKT